MSLRSPLAKAVGWGSAKEGAAHWWWQRITAVALVPLSVWFVFSIVPLAGADHATVVAWMQSPLVASLLILFIVLVLHHNQLGMQVVFEDYIHTEWLKLTCLILLKFATVLIGLIGTLSILKVALGGR